MKKIESLGQLDEKMDSNKTSAALSTNILIKVRDKIIGAIQEISIKEIAPEEGISKGTITGYCERIRFDKQRISQVFIGSFHIVNRQFPFDLEIVENLGDLIITTVLRSVTITEMEYSYRVDNWIISEYIKFKAESISTSTSTSTEKKNDKKRKVKATIK